MVIGGNPMRISIDYDNLSITNFTEKAHAFCCGSVTRTVVEHSGNIYIDTYGAGNNSNIWLAGSNWVAGHVGFVPSTTAIQNYVTNSVPRPYRSQPRSE
jgi:hypothetical protein